MDLYELLGVRKTASVAEIRRAYQKRARSLHPDLNPGDPAAAERFREVSRAFEVLSDPQRRAAYDRGEPSPTPVAPAVEGGFEGFDFSAQVRIERVGFREIFDAELGAPEPRRGEDLEQATRLTFEESLKGTERRVQAVADVRNQAATQLAPQIHASLSGGAISLRGRNGFRGGLTSTGSPPARLTLLRGQASPVRGWVFPHYRTKVPRTTAELADSGSKVDEVATLSLVRGSPITARLVRPVSDGSVEIRLAKGARPGPVLRVARQGSTLRVAVR